ncbi:uncharacterized protein LOC124294052 [Neodiprion lecontei]|uniref:Uncharacterized protein LOC124294052 n=1 Tax=Neodiprion lecontei TaxID=441921 RepID=A0ABM3G094_NEOLC|nr:uncharacterized protein LOC124217361 [Neodiprion pinetum]XP_046593691.1 uncharacterized protein LOC124294052 [Neodiprion lecontei]
MNLSCSLPKISVSHLTYLKQINLKNYYTSDPESVIVNCKICKFNMPTNHVFEHTVSKRHKYNKLLVRIVQNSSYNGDMDFFIKDIDSLECRYCTALVINSNEDNLVVNHLQSIIHRYKKQQYLKRSSCSSVVDLSVQCDMTLRPLDSLLTYNKKYANQMHNLSKNLPKPKVASVVVKVNPTKSSAFCGIKDTQRREKIPKCITVDENDICMCTVCTKFIPNTTVNINQHVDGKAHKIQLQKLQETAGEDIEDNESYWCKDCCKKVPNNKHNIELHNTGRKHLSKIKAPSVSTENIEHKGKNKVKDPITIMHDLCLRVQQLGQY